MAEKTKSKNVSENNGVVVVPGVGEISKDKIAAALALLERDARNRANQKAKRATLTPEQKAEMLAKAKERRANRTPEQIAKDKERQARQMAKNRVFIRKAREAGIAVTDAEIDAEFAKMQAENHPKS